MGQVLSILLSVFFVAFTDKGGSQNVALSQRAIEQRTKWQIPIDSMDYAVSATYVDSIRTLGGTVLHTSRWMNGATVACTDKAAEQIRQCAFVKDMEKTRDNSPCRSIRKYPERFEDSRENTPKGTDAQLEMHNLPLLHEAGHKGQGIVMAVIDGGFQNYPVGAYKHNGLQDVFDTTRWLGSYDLTDDADPIYGNTGRHGSICLGLIAGQSALYQGAAPEAEYYMMRSEEGETESPKEVDNLVAAIEKADSLGVNIASISLGYAMFDNPQWDYSYSMMDGKQSRCSRAAQIAARKGMLVCVAAGNEGDKTWHYLTAPADADSILCVGAVYYDGWITNFSSRGPSSDGRVKPDVCSMGAGTCIITPEDGSMGGGSGTSFACPLIAGMAACIWSGLPQLNAMAIRQRIIQSASQYRHPDDDYGYGIPDAWRALHGEESGIEEAVMDRGVYKVVQEGVLYIERNGTRYDIMGRNMGK